MSIEDYAGWPAYDTFLIVSLSGWPIYDPNPLRPNPNPKKPVSGSCHVRGLGQTLTPLHYCCLIVSLKSTALFLFFLFILFYFYLEKLFGPLTRNSHLLKTQCSLWALKDTLISLPLSSIQTLTLCNDTLSKYQFRASIESAQRHCKFKSHLVGSFLAVRTVVFASLCWFNHWFWVRIVVLYSLSCAFRLQVWDSEEF